MKIGIVWFRKIIRLHDNNVLTKAIKSKNIDCILPIYILGDRQRSKNQKIFLYQALSDLNTKLKRKYSSRLIVFNGKPIDVFKDIQKTLGSNIKEIFWDYASEAKENGSEIVKKYSKKWKFHIVPKVSTILDIENTISHKKYKPPKSMKEIELVFDRVVGKSKDGFYNVEKPLPVPKKIKPLPKFIDKKVFTKEINLSNKIQKYESEMNPYFIGGETEALKRLQKKIERNYTYVNKFRKPKTISTNSENNPMEPTTTGLSPYISFGCLSIRRFWSECLECYRKGPHTMPPESLHGQLLFREMFYLLSRSVENWDKNVGNIMCKEIDWEQYNTEKMEKWEKGITGFPYIDAMMRQLDKTGWMHHLGRHAVACFLTRGQLWQNWIYGRDVFEKKLLDSDWALNNANWLWLSGVAPFSMPYFRLYNPCPDKRSSLNVETKTTEFIKFWIPELKHFPARYVYEPHLAPISVQQEAKCMVGKDYPMPMVNRKKASKENLAKFKISLEKLRKARH